jgi:hypothetical protein
MGGDTILDDDGLDGGRVILLEDDDRDADEAFTLFRSWVSPSLSPRRNFGCEYTPLLILAKPYCG